MDEPWGTWQGWRPSSTRESVSEPSTEGRSVTVFRDHLAAFEWFIDGLDGIILA